MASVDIWNNPAEEMKVSSAHDKVKASKTLLRGKIGKSAGRLLADTGATPDSSSLKTLNSLNLDVQEADALVHCAGSTDTYELSGIVHLRVGIQNLKADLAFHAIELPPGLDACLGDTWLDRHEAQIIYRQHVRLKQGTRWSTLAFERVEHLPEVTNVCLLSALQVKKMLKKEQCKTCLVNLSQIEETGKETRPQDVKIEESLRGFESVFDPLPPGLPPDRGVKLTILATALL